jgi:chemotaxis protein CheX
MDIKQALIDASLGVFPMFGITPVFQGETEEAQLASANQVNVIIGLSGGIKSNIVFGFKKETALRIISAMMGGMEVKYFDDIAKSAMGEAANMVAGTAVGKVSANSAISFSPPTLVIGDRIFLLVSKVKTNKLNFNITDDIFNISVSIE